MRRRMVSTRNASRVFTALLVVVLGIQALIAPAAHATDIVGGSFDQVLFIDSNGDGIPDSDGVHNIAWTDASTDDYGTGNKGSTYNLFPDVSDREHVKIITAPSTSGMGTCCDAGIQFQENAIAGDIFEASATVAVINVVHPEKFWTRLTIQPRNGGSLIAGSECNVEVSASKPSAAGQNPPVAPPADPPAEQLVLEPCTLPSNTSNLRLKVRAHAEASDVKGEMIISEVSLQYLGNVSR
jgi:hypothetical protein